MEVNVRKQAPSAAITKRLPLPSGYCIARSDILTAN